MTKFQQLLDLVPAEVRGDAHKLLTELLEGQRALAKEKILKAVQKVDIYIVTD
jgi:hypothetical protein